jgi:hypothetical protein
MLRWIGLPLRIPLGLLAALLHAVVGFACIAIFPRDTSMMSQLKSSFVSIWEFVWLGGN